jgi:predicted N-acetyltransferase YhbS
VCHASTGTGLVKKQAVASRGLGLAARRLTEHCQEARRPGYQMILVGSPWYFERMNAITFQISSTESWSPQGAITMPGRPFLIVLKSVASVGE